ncbi:MAG: hypothetical protein Q4D87_01790 [Actinomycetaceae bacterium]|nr:hypothetical protein [Actinomycetaceae bacterium]
MPLFEFDDGRLIPAQFGRSVRDGLTDDILKSVREQVLEIVGRPLFPITWQDSAPVGSGMDGGAPRLTALDASGQVVSVEVVERLDSTTMIDSLSRLADTASLGWNDLAAAYPGGIQGFRMGWAEFRDAMPPSPAPGPRLVLVAGSIADSVRPALDVLASSGVEVHEIAVRVMSNGRKFLDVQAVGPRLYGHNPNLLLGRTSQTLELTSFSSSEVESGESPARHVSDTSKFDESNEGVPADHPVDAEAPGAQASEDEPLEPAYEASEPAYEPSEPVDEDVEADNFDQADDADVATAPEQGDVLVNGAEADQVGDFSQAEVDQAEADRAEDGPADVESRDATEVAPVEDGEVVDDGETAEPAQAEDADAEIPQLQETAEGLHVIGQILGEDTPVIWQHTEVERFEATLTPEGEIRTANWSTGDPNEAAAMVGGSSKYNGWEVWHLGDQVGPSLREALAELNREIRNEYQNAGAPRRGRRTRHDA